MFRGDARGLRAPSRSLPNVSLALVVVCLVTACGGAPTPRAEAPPRPQWDGALADLIPGDASVVVLARPSELVASPAARRVISAFASEQRLESYRQHTGIDPRTLTELAWASTDEGTVLIVRGPFGAPLAVAEMGARMVPVESSADEPYVRRAGHYQGARRDLVAIAEHVLVAVTGAPSLTQRVMARVRGESDEPGVLDGADVASLIEEHGRAPVVVLAPRHLSLPPGSGIALLLSRERALVGTVTAGEGDGLALAVDLRGEFPPGADGNFRTLVESLADTDLGAALGMRDVLATLSVQADDGRVVLRASVPAAALAAGLRVLFDAEIAELVGAGGAGGAPEAAGGARESP